MAKVTPSKRNQGRDTVVVKTSGNTSGKPGPFRWWKAKDKKELCAQVLDTSGFLKEQQSYRFREISVYARMYGNLPIWNFVGSGINKMNLGNNLPLDRPTMNVVQSCVDTLISRVTQSRPRPVFLTDNGDYKERNTAKQMNNFIMGEFYKTKAYELGSLALRDGAVLGDGCIKVYEKDARVCLERVIETELLVDMNDALYGEPRQMFQFKLVDRSVLIEQIPEAKDEIMKAQQGYPTQGEDSSKTASDQIIVVEAWHLPSGKDATDGRHCIVCTEGVIFDEPWKKSKFPFVFMPYSPRVMGFWGQGLTEQLMGTQVEINKLLMTISQSINLVGVPRVFVEDGSKVVKSHLNNNVGAIVTYRGTKPSYEVAPCVPAELYQQLQRLVDYAYQQAGISTLAAAAQKPAGLNSGEAIRNYDDLQTDRFAALVRRYDNMYIELAYQIIDLAKEIAERDGKYTTVYPNKDGTKEIDLPKIKLLDDPVIQCFDASSLPRDPAGRLQKVTEMMQSGIIDPNEGRRLLDYPDIQQVDKLANAAEERILQAMDEIVENGKYTPPDPFMDLQKAGQLVNQYYNLYVPAKLEESKAQMLRDFFTQVQDLKAKAVASMQPPPIMGGPVAPPSPNQPMAAPEPMPTNPMIPNVPQ